MDIQSYIETSLIPRLAMLDEITLDNLDEGMELKNEILGLIKSRYAYALHKEIIPFYEKYIYGDKKIFHSSHNHIRFVIEQIMESDPYFGEWFQGIDLIPLIEEWKNLNSEYINRAVFNIMQTALTNGYDNEWTELSETIRIRLLDEVEYGTSWSREALAIVHGICMIYQSTHSDDVKMQLVEQMKNNWDFLRYLYSAMFKSVIGFKFNNLIQVANMIHGKTGYHPYAHLFYAAFAEHADDLCKKKEDEKKMEKHLNKIIEVMETTPVSKNLDELCNILFPEKLREYLNKHRPKDARQLREEINELQAKLAETTKQMTEQIQEMANKMKALIDTTNCVKETPQDYVTIKEIEEELMKLPEGMAFDVYGKLNTLLVGNEAWAKNTKDIRDRILQRIQTSKPTINAGHYYAPGSTHEDSSQHINIDNTQSFENKQIGQA